MIWIFICSLNISQEFKKKILYFLRSYNIYIIMIWFLYVCVNDYNSKEIAHHCSVSVSAIGLI